jgi:hypothetical protein
MTSDRREYLWKIEDFSSFSITGDFLAAEIEKVIEQIGPKKFVGLVTDGAANCVAARRKINEKYPNIFTMWCVAHHLNLLSKDLCKHEFADSTIKKCQILVNFFKKSHLGMAALRESIEKLQIKGGGIKTFTKTRWSTVFDICETILRLRSAFEDVRIIILLFYTIQILKKFKKFKFSN